MTETSFGVKFSTYKGILKEKDFLPIKAKILSISDNDYDEVSLSTKWVNYHYCKEILFTLIPIPFCGLESVVFKIEISVTNEDKLEKKTYEREFEKDSFYLERDKIINYFQDLFLQKEDFDFTEFKVKNN